MTEDTKRPEQHAGADWAQQVWLWPLEATRLALHSYAQWFADEKSEPPRAPDLEPLAWTTPNTVVLQLRSMRLREFSQTNATQPPLLICAPYALHRALIADFAPGHSLVEALQNGGLNRIYVPDWCSAVPDMRYLSIDNYLAELNVAIEKLDDGFRVERWHMSADPPPYHCKVISNKTDRIDRRNIGRMIVPGIFLLDTMFAPAGQGAEKGVQVPGTRQYRNAQFMTPETRSTTHFFWNYLHDFDIDNPNIALSLRNSLEEAFHEDLAIIEAQQKVFDADPDYKLLAIGADAALTYFRWVLARRIEAEGNAAKAA